MSLLNEIRLPISVLIAPLAVFVVACRDQTVVTPVAPQQTPTVTTTPAIDRTQLGTDPSHNQYKQYVAGLLARTVYRTDENPRFTVEIWDLLVGPGKKSDPATLPGGAIFEVRAGSGVINAGDNSRDVKLGATMAIEDGQSFQIQNGSADSALSIRAVIIQGR